MINFVQFQLNGVFLCVNSTVPYHDIDGLVHDCSIYITNTLEILQSGIKPAICQTSVEQNHNCAVTVLYVIS